MWVIGILSGFQICPTGYVNEERNLIKEYTNALGGEFSESLTCETTHLISKHKTGAKYNKAINKSLVGN